MNVRELQQEIREWADSVFPDRTPKGSLIKMMVEEIPELIAGNLEDELEYADVMILLLDIADLKGIDIQDAVKKKMEINRNRTWMRDPDTGLLHHNKESEQYVRVEFLVPDDDFRGLTIKLPYEIVHHDFLYDAKRVRMIINTKDKVENHFPGAFKLQTIGLVK